MSTHGTRMDPPPLPST